VITMHRIEIVGLFTALKELCVNKNYNSIETIVDAVLNEAKTEPKPQPKPKPKDKK